MTSAFLRSRVFVKFHLNGKDATREISKSPAIAADRKPDIGASSTLDVGRNESSERGLFISGHLGGCQKGLGKG